MTTESEPQLFSGDLRPFPGIPGEWSQFKRQQAEIILSEIRAEFPGMLGDIEPDADIEDFWEDACRISAALHASPTGLLTKEPGTMTTPWSADEMARRFGPVARSEEGGHHGRDTLIDHPVLQQYAGRSLLLGALGGDQPKADVLAWLSSRYREGGVRRAVVKSAERKNGVWSIELDSDREVIADRLMDAMSWSYIRLEGLTNAVLAQDALDLEWEYRLFVVDGVVISGAGCVEEFTPLDRESQTEAFDMRVRRIRGHLQGHTSSVERNPEVVDRLLAFGRTVAAAHGGTVVIDVAIDRLSDRPVVVELNDLPNSGLYASDPWLVANALSSAADRGYRI